MKKILFGITSLTLGGAERVLVDIANKLADKYEITIFTLYAGGELEASLSSKIKRKTVYNTNYAELSSFEKKKISFDLLFLKKHLYKRKVEGDYDIEIAFLEGPITRLFAVRNKKVRKIAWVHNDISLVFGGGIQAALKKWLEKKSYKSYEKLIFVSEDNLSSFEKCFLIETPKQVIYNYIDSKNVKAQAEKELDIDWNKDTINLVTVARLVEQKGIDRWIKVHSKLKKEGSNISVYVIGAGPLKESLEEQIKQEKIEDSFVLMGKQKNPYPYLKQADYFCLFSYFEGYGMVLEEAKILNKPILITDTAAREAVKGYSKATILPNTEEGILQGLRNITQRPQNELIEEYENEDRIDQIIELIERRKKMKISVLTPTYNRAKTLGKLYESLKKNVKYGFEIEWLIMDDGSKDNTEEVVKKFQEENIFTIIYEKQENQGKMRALNSLVQKANGEYLIECDSDDYFTDNAFQLINEHCTLDNETYAFAFLKYNQNYCNIGNLFVEDEEITTMFDLYFKQGETGEKALVFQTEIRKQFCYKLEKDERFITEARMYHKMDKQYHIKGINSPLMICEYREDGYTKNIKDVFKKNPYGYYEYFRELLDMPLRGVIFSKRLYIYKHYILFSVLTQKKHAIRSIKRFSDKVWISLLWLPGLIKTKMMF